MGPFGSKSYGLGSWPLFGKSSESGPDSVPPLPPTRFLLLLLLLPLVLGLGALLLLLLLLLDFFSSLALLNFS